MSLTSFPWRIWYAPSPKCRISTVTVDADPTVVYIGFDTAVTYDENGLLPGFVINGISPTLAGTSGPDTIVSQFAGAVTVGHAWHWGEQNRNVNPYPRVEQMGVTV